MQIEKTRKSNHDLSKDTTFLISPCKADKLTELGLIVLEEFLTELGAEPDLLLFLSFARAP
tara:strand:- start:544 stop:726 length:183 start_codon:yes stop_codon:yes gene_type:complete